MRRLMLLGVVAAAAVVSVSARVAPPAHVNDGYGDFVFVPAGAFSMGDNFGDGESRERPVHVVDLDAFYIGKYEITNADWRKFQDDPGYANPAFWPNGYVTPKDQIPYWTQANNHGGGTPGSDPYPVLGVNWDSAVAYCHWLSAKTGKTYRLPTEAEWEKAARGTDQRKYPWGNTIDHSYANFVEAQAVRHRPARRLLRRIPTRRSADARQRVAVRRLRHGGQRDGVVRGLVQPGLLFRFAKKESDGAGHGRLSRAARWHLLRRSLRPSHLRALGRVAFTPGAPDDRVQSGATAVVLDRGERAAPCAWSWVRPCPSGSWV